MKNRQSGEETVDVPKNEWKKYIKEKPCKKLRYCPYGPLVENFPLKEVNDEVSCSVYGHDCPAFTMASVFIDGQEEWSSNQRNNQKNDF